MTTVDFLRDLRSRGVVLTPRGKTLIVDAPAGALTVEDRVLLAHRKAQLLELLLTGMPDNLPPEWHVLWDERSAIMEYEAGIPRERAEALALADILHQMQRTDSPLRP